MMTSENNDGAFLDPPHLQDFDSYDDLLGVQFPVEALKLQMSEHQQEPLQYFSALDKEVIQDTFMATPDPEAVAQIQNTVADDHLPESAAKSCRIVASKAHDAGITPDKNDRSNVTPTQHGAVKKVSPIRDRVIEIPDVENEIVIKEEEDECSFNWTSMPDDVISVSEDEGDETLVLQPDGSSVPIKKEDDEVEFVWAEMGDRVIELDSDSEPDTASKLNLGNSFLRELNLRGKRPPIDRSAARRAQEAYLQTYRRKHDLLGPSADPGVLNEVELQGSKRPESPVDENGSAWMNATYTPHEDSGKKFRALKKSYSAKIKTDTNTINDDIEYARAEKAENLRLARLKAEYNDLRGYSDDDNPDDSLFVSTSSTTTASLKRRAAGGPNGEDGNTGASSAKKSRPNSNGTGAHQGPDQELEINLMAGLEGHIAQLAKKGKGKSVGTNKMPKNSVQKRAKRKSDHVGHLNSPNSLLTGNIYEDANANLNREALPASGHAKNKKKALAALVASVPVGTPQKGVIAEKNRILKATVTLGRGVPGGCKADGNNDWRLAGMKSSLRHHQVQGAAFMKDREIGGEEPLGGILADAMGLGKTLMTIALMISNPPPRDEKNRATLIVCSPGLLMQWEREIETHTEDGHLDLVLKHHSVTRVSGKAAVYVMQGQEVILTTYQEVIKSYPKLEVPTDIRDEKELRAWWERQWNQERDVLHKVQFYRVVLDESQVIKNHATQTSIACRALMAKHRWTLSGTPIMNRLEELYPYFKFLRVPCTGCFRDFQDNYCNPGSNDCNSRLHCLLDQIMCRRTHRDTILGAPIVKLPKHNQRTISIRFSPVEQEIYRRVHRAFVIILNRASATGQLEKYPSLGLVAFLRLRQLCAHTFLVQEVLEKLLNLEDIDKIEDEFISGVTQENRNDRNLLAALRRMIEAKSEVMGQSEEPEEPEQLQSGTLVARFGGYLKTLKTESKWVELRTRTQCHSCGEPPESAMVTSCLHVYCEECLQGMAHRASAKNQDGTPCLACGVVFAGAQSCVGLKELEWDDCWLLNEMAGRKTGSKKVNMEWVTYENKLVMSAKTTAVRNQIEQWLEEEPDKKIIIFSQFHMIMQILEQVCQKKNWKYCTYHGKMSHKARDKVITGFANDDEMKIMIASLKCGGIGLNLTMASKVVCIDLWYNSCMEQQAFCRVFRIGQTSETFITRFVVINAADGKLMDMQLKKNALIGQAMDDKSVLSNLTTDEILRLFGKVKFDKNKRPFILLDDDEKLDSLFHGKD